jgi:hypothetical protein
MAGPRWVKVDTSYLRNPKITALTPSGVLLHLASICYAADQLTDGQIPARTLAELAVAARLSPPQARRTADELVEHRLWVPNGDGWWLHDFATMNRQSLRAVVEKQRASWRDSKKDSGPESGWESAWES